MDLSYTAGSCYRQLGQTLESREPAARSEFDLHIHDQQLIYTQSPCNSLGIGGELLWETEFAVEN